MTALCQNYCKFLHFHPFSNRMLILVLWSINFFWCSQTIILFSLSSVLFWATLDWFVFSQLLGVHWPTCSQWQGCFFLAVTNRERGASCWPRERVMYGTPTVSLTSLSPAIYSFVQRPLSYPVLALSPLTSPTGRTSDRLWNSTALQRHVCVTAPSTSRQWAVALLQITDAISWTSSEVVVWLFFSTVAKLLFEACCIIYDTNYKLNAFGLC